MTECFATPEELIADTRGGRVTLLLDDEGRENEGDLIISAEHASPEVIAFMAAHGRGLICLCLTEERVAALGLGPMVETNGTRHGTAPPSLHPSILPRCHTIRSRRPAAPTQLRSQSTMRAGPRRLFRGDGFSSNLSQRRRAGTHGSYGSRSRPRSISWPQPFRGHLRSDER